MQRRTAPPPRAIALVYGVAIAGAVLLACNALTGADKLAADPSGDSAIAPTGEDVVSDAGQDATDAVAPRPEVDAEPPAACPSAGRRCVPLAPDGWTGPLVVYDGPPTTTLACPASMARTRVDVNGGQPIASHTCSACSCGAPAGVACSGTLDYYSGCTFGFMSTTPQVTTCKAVEFASGGVTAQTTAQGGSCAPAGGTAQPSAVTWPSGVIGCGAPELLKDGCATDEVCAPEPPTGFRAQHCVAQDGDVACVAPWTVKLTGYSTFTDTRTCSACSCGSPSGVVCQGTLRYYGSSTNCTGPVKNVTLPTTACTTTVTNASVRLAGALAPSGGSCTSTAPSTPTGGVQGAGPVTLCCMR